LWAEFYVGLDSLIQEKISKEILSWPGVTSGQHRFGGTEFRVGKREMGHIHGDKLADLPFPMPGISSLSQVMLHHIIFYLNPDG
jgi:hypothetical protein